MKIRMAVLLLVSAFGAPAVAEVDDRLPQFPKVAPPDTLPDAACDAPQAHATAWALGRWTSGRINVTITPSGWTVEGGQNATGAQVGIENCVISLSGPGPGFEAVRTETGALYGGLRVGDAAPRYTLFHREN